MVDVTSSPNKYLFKTSGSLTFQAARAQCITLGGMDLFNVESPEELDDIAAECELGARDRQ